MKSLFLQNLRHIILNEKKVLGHSLSNSGLHYGWAGFFHSDHRYTSQQQILWECPFAFLSLHVTSLPLLSLLNCPPWVPVQYLPQRGPPGVRGEGFRTPRSLQRASGSHIRLPIFHPPLLPAQVISNEKCHFNDTRIIHLNHGDALEQDILHCRKPKCVCICICLYNPQKLVKPHVKLQISLTSWPIFPKSYQYFKHLGGAEHINSL